MLDDVQDDTWILRFFGYEGPLKKKPRFSEYDNLSMLQLKKKRIEKILDRVIVILVIITIITTLVIFSHPR